MPGTSRADPKRDPGRDVARFEDSRHVVDSACRGMVGNGWFINGNFRSCSKQMIKYNKEYTKDVGSFFPFWMFFQKIFQGVFSKDRKGHWGLNKFQVCWCYDPGKSLVFSLQRTTCK